MANTKKALLMILDGWGIGDKSKSDAIFNTPTPFIDSLIENYPNSQLLTSGEHVGLPDGQMGNSEVGHLNIGAGRVVYQDLVKINKAIEEDTLKNNEQIQKAYNYAKENNKNVHLIGLVGPGGVHALTKHMTALAKVAGSMGLENVYVHGLTDGRDTDPKSAYGYVKEALESLEGTPAKFVSLIGRYFGMDRDENWDRVKLMYDQLTKGEGEKTDDFLASIQASYEAGVNDEFIKPLVSVDTEGNAEGLIQEGDVVICYNYRTDRLRQLTRVFTQEDHSDFGMKTMDLQWYTMTTYNESFKGINVIFDKANITETLGEVVEKAGLKQIRTAETEKFAHVTFFFSGGRESEFVGENRILVPSPKVATYDLQPEMSAPIVTGKLLPELEAQSADFICLNFANGDMVGHTGDYSAIEKAISSVDNCAKQVVETAQANGYDVVIIADHGNADNALNKDGSVNTAHSLNPVPFIWVTDQKDKKVKSGILADVAPTILNIMGLEIPAAMTGQVLIEE
ncbi:2,3-bisphosphoglycerate-independent phosphoglycerate mutase [Prolixibacteraceae bacterium]|nr:2,3-bisphosphoglycerate-independent phosphoglycerate mutase [Prolixibacteraceae bacterium]